MITDVAKWLEDNNMTPSKLAEELDLPRSQVSRLIAGEEEVDRVIGWALVGLGTRKKTKGSNVSAAALPTAALAEDLDDDSWTGQTARLALPILAEIAQSEPRTISYKELHEMIADRGGKKDIGTLTKYSFPLGRVATAIENLGDKIPPITSIVVRGTSGMPSNGIDVHIRNYLDLSGAEAKTLKDTKARGEIVQRLWNDVFSYKKWPEVIARLGLTGDPRIDL